MKRCLKDKTLLLLHAGGGTKVQRNHLTECILCAARYRDLGSDLDVISQALREEPPPQIVNRPSHSRAIRWAPAAVVAVLALIIVWQGARMWRSPARPSASTDNMEFLSLVDGFPANLFLLSEAMAVEPRTTAGESYEWAATILEADRPCEWYDVPVRAEGESSMEESEVSPLSRSCVDVTPKPAQETPVKSKARN